MYGSATSAGRGGGSRSTVVVCRQKKKGEEEEKQCPLLVEADWDVSGSTDKFKQLPWFAYSEKSTYAYTHIHTNEKKNRK